METQKLHSCLHFSLSRSVLVMEGVGTLLWGISMESSHPKSLENTLCRTVLVGLWRLRVCANHPLMVADSYPLKRFSRIAPRIVTIWVFVLSRAGTAADDVGLSHCEPQSCGL